MTADSVALRSRCRRPRNFDGHTPGGTGPASARAPSSPDGRTLREDHPILADRGSAEHHGWQIVEVYEDAGISGARGREERPGFDRMLRGAVRREFDVILAWSVDRLGRSLQDLVAFLSEIHAKGRRALPAPAGHRHDHALGQGDVPDDGVFAEFERAMIRERVLAGLKRARARGKKLGRPMISPAKERAIRADLAAGLGFRRIMARQGVGT